MKINYCDALVIGGGLAGLRAAVAAQKKGIKYNCFIFSSS